MKKNLLKFLPLISAVLLATSCSKDDENVQTQNPASQPQTQSTIPFSIRVNTGKPLTKIGYAEDTNESEKGWYNVTFSDDDVDKLKMIIKENGTQIGEATLQPDKATFSGGLTQPPLSNTADLTAEITVIPKDAKTFSDESLAALLATCAHTFLGTFKYGAAEVTLTDQNAYLAITYFESDKIDLNGSTIDLTDNKVWVAVPANAEVTSQALGISKPAKEVAPGTIYTVDRYFTPMAFSVSADKQVFFSKGNLQYNPAQDKWRFAPHQYDLCEKSSGDVSSMYDKDYDGWIDLFGWGTWLNGENVLKPYETQTGHPETYIWSGGNSTIGENWTTLSKDEWIYLLGDDEKDETPCRKDAKTLRGTKTVEGVSCLVILPDGSKANLANDSWENLEKAGAVFLPATGRRDGTGVYRVDCGYYWSSSASGEDDAYDLCFDSDYVGPADAYNRDIGFSVRLVR